MISKEAQHASSITDIDFTKQDPKAAVTYEFCAGIVDKKHLSNKEHAHAEILEECGYSVDINSIESVAKYRTGVGTAGPLQELFYVEVTNEMKKTAGGGNSTEQERKIKLKNEDYFY
jgi:UDP-sugar diphosphatase